MSISRYHHHTHCIPLTENYDYGLRREERWQLIPIKKSAVKNPPVQKKIFKIRETYNLQEIHFALSLKINEVVIMVCLPWTSNRIFLWKKPNLCYHMFCVPWILRKNGVLICDKSICNNKKDLKTLKSNCFMMSQLKEKKVRGRKTKLILKELFRKR